MKVGSTPPLLFYFQAFSFLVWYSMKKYKKNTGIVDAVQFDGTEETLDEIKELLGDKVNLIDQVAPDGKTFSLIGKTKNYRIFKTDWIVKDEIDKEHTLFFVVSDDIFQITHSEIS